MSWEWGREVLASAGPCVELGVGLRRAGIARSTGRGGHCRPVPGGPCSLCPSGQQGGCGGRDGVNHFLLGSGSGRVPWGRALVETGGLGGAQGMSWATAVLDGQGDGEDDRALTALS